MGVAFGSFGENPVGMQDEMTSVDILRITKFKLVAWERVLWFRRVFQRDYRSSAN